MASETAQISLRKILLASDLSARCDRALDRAAMLAAESSAQLTVVHAFKSDALTLTRDALPVPSWRQRPDSRQTIAMRQLHDDLGLLDLSFDLVLEEGSPTDVIMRAASDRAADLIVTGIARGETLGHFIFGGTVDRLVRNGSPPVLVVKNRARQAYKDIVVATDFSAASRKAIDATSKIFPTAKISLLHCYGATAASIARPNRNAEDDRQIAEDQYAEFINRNPLATASLTNLPIFMEGRAIDSVIQDYAAGKGLDLLVIGSKGKNAITRAFTGSAAELAMASAPTDVLVITP